MSVERLAKSSIVEVQRRRMNAHQSALFLCEVWKELDCQKRNVVAYMESRQTEVVKGRRERENRRSGDTSVRVCTGYGI